MNDMISKYDKNERELNMKIMNALKENHSLKQRLDEEMKNWKHLGSFRSNIMEKVIKIREDAEKEFQENRMTKNSLQCALEFQRKISKDALHKIQSLKKQQKRMLQEMRETEQNYRNQSTEVITHNNFSCYSLQI